MLTCTVDTSGLNRGLALAGQFTRKAPAQACNYAALSVAYEAQANTPFVTPQTVDTELAVIKTPLIGKRGKPKKKLGYGSAKGSADRDDVSLAVLIIQARGQYNSEYNQLTNYRYALFGSPFKGVSRAAGAALMSTLIHQMIASRHKSGHFIAAGWLPSIKIMAASDRGVAGTPRNAGGWFGKSYNDKIGNASPAQIGSTVAVCTIENDVGLEGMNAESHNRALMLTTPILQRAVDTVGAREMNYALAKLAKEDLEGPVNKAWS